jgi:RNA polymerase sigma-70 factor (ECF subfamily)
MAITLQARLAGTNSYLPTAEDRLEQYQEIYQNNYHRIYSLAFRMSGNELAAEDVVSDVFRRAFSLVASPSAELLDRALVRELREQIPIGFLSLECSPISESTRIRGNVKRVHLEEAVGQLPATERLVFLMHDVEGYDHVRISKTIGLSEAESLRGLHQARLRLRELLSRMF